MNENSAKIDTILQSCEKDIRGVIVTAAQAGDYEAVQRGMDVAVRVSALLTQPDNFIQRETVTQAAPALLPQLNAVKNSKGRGKSSEYPRFEISQNNLVRYGWSKKEKREYNHKVPKSAFDNVITAIAKISSANKKGPHTAEAIIELTNTGLDEPVPNYQVYAILGFLRLANTIEQQGREGYVIPGDFTHKAQECWK